MPKKMDKIIREMSENAKKVLVKLVDDIRERGPEQSAYHNYSKLGAITYHCHLAYSWVVCWCCNPEKFVEPDGDERERRILVEVEYVGSREKAPY
jgi:hypothetical protein